MHAGNRNVELLSGAVGVGRQFDPRLFVFRGFVCRPAGFDAPEAVLAVFYSYQKAVLLFIWSGFGGAGVGGGG